MKKASETGLDKVKPRIFKALALALASMMFGADARDAFSQGLEVVGKDYAAEAALVAAENKSLADLEDYTNKEIIKSRLKIREDAAKFALENPGKIQASNNAVLKEIGTHIQGMDPKLKDSLKLASASGHLSRALGLTNKAYGQIDLADPMVRGAFELSVMNWLKARSENKNYIEPLESFVQDQIARDELVRYSPTLNIADIVPDTITNSKQQRKDVAALWSKVMTVARVSKGGNILGESSALKLIKKDFDDYTKNKTSAEHDAREAVEKGMTPFTYFVATYVVDDNIGRKHDKDTDTIDLGALLAGVSRERFKEMLKEREANK
jgi:hypothetical protein